MSGVRFVVDGKVLGAPPGPMRRRAYVEVDEHGETTVTMSTRAGRKQEIPPEVRERIVRLREQGMTLRQIARRLQEDGVPTPRGKPWSNSSVQYVLKPTRNR